MSRGAVREARPARQRHVLPVLALLACAASGVAALCWATWLECDDAIEDSRAAARATEVKIRAARARARRGPAALGRCLQAPATPAEVREMVRFCDTAGRDDVARLREVALSSPCALAVSNAVRALGRLREVAGDPSVLALLGDSRERVRHETILALGEAGASETARKALTEIVVTGAKGERELAIHALGRLRGEAVDGTLAEVLGDARATSEEKAFARAALAVRAR